MHNIYKYFSGLCLVIGFLALLVPITSCKKETVNTPYPYHEIRTFRISTANEQSLSAALTQKEIIIYWPSYLEMPDSIAPQITVSDHAVISPASGEKVPLKDGITYTVTAQNKDTTTYRVKLVINQPEVLINMSNGLLYLEYGTSINLAEVVQQFIPDVKKTSVSLLDANNKEIPLTISSIGGPGNPLVVDAPAVTTADTGLYKLKITSGIRAATSAQAFFKIVFPNPLLTPPAATIMVKRGATFTLSGSNIRSLTGTVLARKTDGGEYNLETVSNTLETITIKIPADFPEGDYNRLRVGYVNYREVMTNASLSRPSPVLTITQ